MKRLIKGQSMVEYALILILVAVIAFTIYTLFEPATKNFLCGIESISNASFCIK